MQPVNPKSVKAFVYEEMKLLRKKEVTTEEAKAMNLLAQTTINLDKAEQSRAITIMKLAEHNAKHGNNLQLRDLDSNPLEN